MKRLIYILFVALFLSGCRSDSMIEVIDSDVRLKLWETVDSTGRSLMLYCSTEKQYSCSNYAIDRSFNVSPGNIQIDFNGITTPEICLTSIGPATTTINLGSLANGTYQLVINVERNKSEGRLIVTSGFYEIILDQQEKLQIVNPILNRIPDNTIWGNVGYHTSTTAPLVQSFIDSLLQLGATSQVYQQGDYV